MAIALSRSHLARLGKIDEARKIIAAFREKHPYYTVQKAAVWPTWKNPQMKEPYLAAYLADLIKAGLPESSGNGTQVCGLPRHRSRPYAQIQ